ncbi:hypothetical protein FACS1894139_07290 [Planctomycetales bacterium]|nr:hypothetical protein FACS1894107_11700 [Planctomycetales bacterium]GHT01183.1 hypothetical protein FACS1894108_14600 [Planctomycetales bacterium]GHT04703.1 hypothetical protein FACS1894139_07290 [Planctomycetales bacterium]
MTNEVQPAAGTPPAPVKAGVIVLVAELAAMLVTIFAGLPLALVVIILAIICMTRSRVGAGIFLLVGATVLGGIFYLIGWGLLAGAVAAKPLKEAHDRAQHQSEIPQQNR